MTETAASLLTAFMQASTVPVVKPVVWPPAVNTAHPLRKLDLYVRYWSVETKALIDGIIAAENDVNPPPPPPALGQQRQPYTNTWVPKIYWYVIAASICEADGTSIFASNWPDVYRQYLTTDPLVVPQYDSLSCMIIPPPGFNIIGTNLQKAFDTEQGRTITWPLFEQALFYNGFSGEASKNSEKID